MLKLLDILRSKRVSRGDAEDYVIRTYIKSLPNVHWDAFGNHIVKVGPSPARIAFSCHTDSVHQTDGRQHIVFVPPYTIKTTDGECLGADCGIGIWLMHNMVLNNVPGLYIFHRDEETGAEGAQWLLDQHPGLFNNVDAMIAFDRMGYESIVTHQMRTRTASDEFAKSLSRVLRMPNMKPDPTGVFTDSYEYRSVIPECTNISVGYHNQHTMGETQNIQFAQHLLERLLTADWSKLIIHRDPNHREVIEFVQRYPGSVAKMLERYGFTFNQLMEISYGQSKT